MGVFRSIYRYISTLGGLIESDIDSHTDSIVSTPSGIKATFKKTREQWTKQYADVRESVAQLMIVLDKKRKQLEASAAESDELKLKMKGAISQYKSSNDGKYQQAFTELYERDKELAEEQEKLDGEIKELHAKVDQYKDKLKEMQNQIAELDQRESEAIADIVSSQQIINLNDRLSNLSTRLDDENLTAIEKRRDSLKSQAKLSSELTSAETTKADLDQELLNVGKQSEAADVFAAMLAEESKKAETGKIEVKENRSRDL